MEYRMDHQGNLQKHLTNQEKCSKDFSNVHTNVSELDRKELLDMLRLVRGFERKIKYLLDMMT
jgi:hypothetical protein